MISLFKKNNKNIRVIKKKLESVLELNSNPQLCIGSGFSYSIGTEFGANKIGFEFELNLKLQLLFRNGSGLYQDGSDQNRSICNTSQYVNESK